MINIYICVCVLHGYRNFVLTFLFFARHFFFGIGFKLDVNLYLLVLDKKKNGSGTRLGIIQILVSVRALIVQVRPEIKVYPVYIIWWSFNSSNLKKQNRFISLSPKTLFE